MTSRVLFCRTERGINSEEDDYLPDLDSQPVIHYDRQNVPQGTDVTFKVTKQDVIKKIHFVTCFHPFNGYISALPRFSNTYVPGPVAPISVHRSTFHDEVDPPIENCSPLEGTSHQTWQNPSRSNVAKENLENTFDDNYEILDDSDSLDASYKTARKQDTSHIVQGVTDAQQSEGYYEQG